jgi:micrococcal nuclease
MKNWKKNCLILLTIFAIIGGCETLTNDDAPSASPSTSQSPRINPPTPSETSETSEPSAEPTQPVRPLTVDEGIVVKVTDGDTIRVQNLKGKEFGVRVVGIDTPETVDPRTPVQCFGPKASAEAKKRLSGKRVRLVRDPKSEKIDKYGRTLAYVQTKDGDDYGLGMIKDGLAREYTYKRPHDRQKEYRRAQNEAKVEKKGMWGVDIDPVTRECAKPKAKPKPTREPTTDVPSVYYENCSEVRAAGKAPIYPDDPGWQEKFDRDNDGVGCET